MARAWRAPAWLRGKWPGSQSARLVPEPVEPDNRRPLARLEASGIRAGPVLEADGVTSWIDEGDERPMVDQARASRDWWRSSTRQGRRSFPVLMTALRARWV